MPLIKRRPKEIIKPFTVRLPESLSKRLEQYAEFTNVPVGEIVAEAVKYALESDKEFSTEGTQSAISSAPETHQIVISGAPETHQKRTASDSTNKAVSA